MQSGKADRLSAYAYVCSVRGGIYEGGSHMDLVNSIAQMSVSMSQANFQQGVQMSMMKKAMDSNAAMMDGVLRMLDSVPGFAGANGSILNVRA